MAKATAILHKKGEGPLYPIYLRISNKQQRSYKATNWHIREDQWDDKEKKVKKHPKMNEINAWLAARVAELQSDIVIHKKEAFTVEKKVKWQEAKRQFLTFNESILKESSLQQYRSEFKKIEDYREPKFINDITVTWLEDYERYLRQILKNSQNTVWRAMKFLRTLFNFAVKKDLVTVDPFKKYERPAYRQTERKHLSPEEVNSLDSLLHSGLLNGTAHDCTVWFLFSCYTGLRLSDIISFDYDSIKNGRIILHMQKTGEPVSLKINDRLGRIIELSRKCQRFAPQWTNQALKSVAAMAGIKQDISFHMARHTFAVRCADLGMSQEVTGRLLGHTNIRTTAIYYKITDKRIDDEMDRFNY